MAGARAALFEISYLRSESPRRTRRLIRIKIMIRSESFILRGLIEFMNEPRHLVCYMGCSGFGLGT
jgi:hypothetical protein